MAADTVGADLSKGDAFQQVWAHHVNVSIWYFVGGGRQPFAAERVRGLEEEEEQGPDKMSPRGVRGPLGTSR